MRLQLKWTLALFFIVLQFSFAQEKTVSGTVKDESGMPLPGVAVLVKGTTQGTQTDFDGNYTISAKIGDVLRFSYIGMQTVEEKIGSNSTIDVTLKVDAQELGEVVVMAYGTEKKASVVGSAKEVDGEKIQSKNTADVSKALASEAAGVQVINTSGQPGTNGTIRIRGFGSVNGSRAPLYVVDGLPYDGDLSSLDPSDIESTTILKDASATALYGARGANGVVLITTRKGKKGTSKIEVSLRSGFNMQLLPMYDVIDSPERYMEISWEALKNNAAVRKAAGEKAFVNVDPVAYASANIIGGAGIDAAYNMWNVSGDKLIDPKTGLFYPGVTRKYTPDSWRDAIFSTGLINEVGVKVSGGSERSSHYVSLSYRSDEGYYLKSSFDRFSVRSNLTHDVKDWLKIGANMNYAHMNYSSPGQTGASNNGFNFVNNMPPIFPVFERDKDGNKIEDTRIGGYLYDYGFALGGSRNFSSGINPAGAVRLDEDLTSSDQIVINPFAEFKIAEGLKFMTKFSAQYLVAEYSTLTNAFYGDAKGLGRVNKIDDKTLSYTISNILTWDKSFGDHSISLLGGQEAYSTQFRRFYARKSKLADPYNLELDNAIIKGDVGSYLNELNIESYLFQAKYDYKDRYFLTLNGRRDGTSRFPENKWGNFGAVGASWMMSRENFLTSVDWLKELKLKVSYGVIGNQAIGGYYPTFDTYTIENLDGEISLKFQSKGNKDLTWERSATFNTGVEFNINDIFEGSIEVFKKNTTNLLFYKQVPISFGYASYPVNEGELLNKGIEVDFTAHVINTNDVKLDLRFNGSHYTNEIISMPTDAKGNEKDIEQHGAFAYQKGRSLFDYYMREYAGVNPDTGVSEWYVYYDETASGKVAIDNLENYKSKNEITKLVKEKTNNYDDATLAFLDKSLIPTLTGGFGIDFSYKGFEINTQFYYSIGGYAYDAGYADLMENGQIGSANWHTDIERRWQKPGDITDVPRLNADYDKKVTSRSSRFLTDASYLGLNNASIAYTLPKGTLESIGLSKAKVFLSGDNLFLYTKRDGFNPNTSESGTSNNYRYSPLSSVSLGVKVDF